ncbi:MAG TPA: anti-sigma factor [Tepidisphaeraceae bacterium]|jgi:anti-sigma factor RsiW
MVDCENRVRLDAYHDGELSPAERSDVEAHLRDCPSCAAELAAIRRMSGAFADTTPPEPSHEQLRQLAASVRAEKSAARMLLLLFRGTAVAAAVLLACALAGAAYLSQRTKAAAHEALVLDHLTIWSQSAALATDPVSDERQSEQRLALAQWIADDLRGRQEERR